MVITDCLHRLNDLPEGARAYARDTITLGWEDRMHVHGRRRSDGGLEFGTSLRRGTVLHEGDCFVLDEARTVVVVVERPESVFVVEPRAEREWALFAYQIGNRHQPLMITNRALVCLDAPGVEQLLQTHAMPYTRTTQPFTPVTAVAGHQH